MQLYYRKFLFYHRLTEIKYFVKKKCLYSKFTYKFFYPITFLPSSSSSFHPSKTPTPTVYKKIEFHRHALSFQALATRSRERERKKSPPAIYAAAHISDNVKATCAPRWRLLRAAAAAAAAVLYYTYSHALEFSRLSRSRGIL